MKFNKLSLDESILSAVDAAGFEECTEVQARAIPLVLEGRDVAVQSQTGTGKTAAFLVPIYHLLRHEERFHDSRVLIIAPTRELAVQIKEESDLLSRDLDINSDVFYGGVGYQQQHKALAGNVRIMVGTPGRLIDLNESGHFDFRDVGILVIDEADRLFDMGFYPDLRKMLRRMRPREERLNMLFSATLSVKARNIAWEHMNNPAEIEIEPEQITVDRVEQRLYHVAFDEKIPLLLGLLKKTKPKSAIVFTNTKKQAEIVAKRLEINGYPAEFIIGDLPQKKRLKIINRIKKGESEFLVATDVAARGLHINSLDLVVNFDVPEDPEAYVHRIGRTARAGESGLAITLACERYVFGLEAIEKLIGIKIPVPGFDDGILEEDQSRDTFIRLDNEEPRRGGGRDSRRRESGRRSSGRRDSGRRDSVRHDSGRARSSRIEEPGRGPARAAKPAHSHTSKPARSQPRQRPPESPQRKDSVEERLAYYRKKYGEDFKPTGEMLRNFEAEQRAGRRKGSKPGRGGNAAVAAEKTRKPEQSSGERDAVGKKGFFTRLFGKRE